MTGDDIPAAGYVVQQNGAYVHVCWPPGDTLPVGTVWACTAPSCDLSYRYRPVAVSELGGRVINLWVRR